MAGLGPTCSLLKKTLRGPQAPGKWCLASVCLSLLLSDPRLALALNLNLHYPGEHYLPHSGDSLILLLIQLTYHMRLFQQLSLVGSQQAVAGLNLQCDIFHTPSDSAYEATKSGSLCSSCRVALDWSQPESDFFQY